jgi:thiamine biosynthesis protein ThiI
MVCTDEVVSMPVFRPLIGMDKDEIVKIARKIDTFDISIEPYEDCCTVFTPKHPRTRPILKCIKLEEDKLNWYPFISDAINQTIESEIN